MAQSCHILIPGTQVPSLSISKLASTCNRRSKRQESIIEILWLKSGTTEGINPATYVDISIGRVLQLLRGTEVTTACH